MSTPTYHTSANKNSASYRGLRPQVFRFAVAITPILLLAASGARTQAGAIAAFSIEDLGTLGSDTRANSINNSGQAAGHSFTLPSDFAHAFLFTSRAGLIDLNQFSNSAITYGAGINNSGQVSGSVDVSGGAGGYHAFRYTEGIGLVDLGTLPGYTFSYGGAINERGQVTGSAYGPGALRAFRYTDGVGMQDLSTLGGSSVANGINNSGLVVGSSETPATPSGDAWNPGHAFLYTDATGMEDLNNLIEASSGWELRVANGINNRGQIVGYGQHVGAGIRAFRYGNGTVTDLGTFPGGGISYALAINNRGDVVGAAYLDASGVGNFRAMLYTDRLGIQNLNNLIDQSLGWVLRQATGINDRGQIVGWGYLNDGKEHAFRLTPSL